MTAPILWAYALNLSPPRTSTLCQDGPEERGPGHEEDPVCGQQSGRVRGRKPPRHRDEVTSVKGVSHDESCDYPWWMANSRSISAARRPSACSKWTRVKKAIVSKTMVEAPPHEKGAFPVWLRDQGTSVILAGGMGPRAVQMFEQFGIKVVAGVAGGDPAAVVEAFLSGHPENHRRGVQRRSPAQLRRPRRIGTGMPGLGDRGD